MARVTFAAVLVIALTFFNVCQSSSVVLQAIDSFLGFGKSKMDVMHALNGIISSPDFQCRLALSVKDREGISLLLNALSPLEELVTMNEEFIEILSDKQQVEILEIYFNNLHPNNSFEPIGGKALDTIMTIIHREDAFELLKLALNNKIISEREVLIYYLKHRQDFLAVIKAGILKHVDITTPILVGKGILHVLMESGEEALCEAILKRLNVSTVEKIKSNHFTKIERNSILHSAVLSDNPNIIGKVVRDFSILCRSLNVFEMSPLKLALVNGNNFESIKVLLEHGCVADGEVILNEEHEIDFKNFEEKFELDKFSKFAPNLISQFKDFSYEAQMLSNICKSNTKYYFLGLLNSSRNLMNGFDRLLDSDLIGSPSLRPRQNFKMKKSPSLWSILADANFNENSITYEDKFPVSRLIEGLNCNYCAREKSQVLKNLTKIESLDFSGVTLTHFIKYLIKYSEPSVFAHFVNKYIEFYFCIRNMFKMFKSSEYEKLIPFLNAIGFNIDESFIDGIYPIHLAVQTNNLALLKFLIKSYNVDLKKKTVYEGNNILHYGLNDRSSMEMIDFLLANVPDLLSKENNFGVTPLWLSLTRTEKFENVDKILNVYQVSLSYNFEYTKEVKEIFEEINENWPNNPVSENHARTKFQIMFETCGSNEVARLLLEFVSKKLLKHYVKERGTSVKQSLIKKNDSFNSPNQRKSPNSVAYIQSP